MYLDVLLSLDNGFVQLSFGKNVSFVYQDFLVPIVIYTIERLRARNIILEKSTNVWGILTRGNSWSVCGMDPWCAAVFGFPACAFHIHEVLLDS